MVASQEWRWICERDQGEVLREPMPLRLLRKVYGTQRNVDTLLFRTKLRSFSFSSTLIAFMIGLWLINPNVDTFGSAPGFREVARVAAETTWGIALTCVSLLRFYALFRNLYWLRIHLGYVALAIYLYLGILFYIVNPDGLAIFIYGGLAIGEFISCTVVGIRLDNGRRDDDEA